MDTVIVVVGPNCWGKGKTIPAALARAKQNYGGRKPETMAYNAYEASTDFSVNDWGTIEAAKLTRLRQVRFADDGTKTVRIAAEWSDE